MPKHRGNDKDRCKKYLTPSVMVILYRAGVTSGLKPFNVHFPALIEFKIVYVLSWVMTYFSLCNDFPADAMLQASRCFHGKCPGDSLVPSFQNFTARIHHATSTESNYYHFLCIPFVSRKFHPYSLFPRSDTSWNKLPHGDISKYYSLNPFKPKINRYLALTSTKLQRSCNSIRNEESLETVYKISSLTIALWWCKFSIT